MNRAHPMPFVSVIVPVHRDEPALARLLDRLVPGGPVEVIVASTGDPRDRRDAAILAVRHPRVRWVTAPRGRGTQMNAGARHATGDWLVFLHADTRLPDGWLAEIVQADRAGAVGGWFAFALDSDRRVARHLEAAVRWRVRLFALPYGDQALFVRRDVFARMGGYRPWPLMEDVELVGRLRRQGAVHRAHRAAITSARRWEQDGWIARSARNVLLLALYALGVPPATLARWYGRARRDAGRD